MIKSKSKNFILGILLCICAALFVCGIFAISNTKDKGQTVTAEAATSTPTIYWGVSGTTLYISSSSLSSSYSPSGTHSGATQAPWSTTGNMNASIRNNITKININKNIVVTSIYNWFNKFPNLTDISTLTKVDVSNFYQINNLFDGNTSLTDISAVANWQFTKCVQALEVFRNCISLTDISPISNWDTSNFEWLKGMFWNCTSLTDISPISGWNTSKVFQMSELFYNCTSLTDVSPISGWDTSKVTTVSYMFYGCSSLAAIDISNLNFDSVTNCDSMFEGTTALESVTLSDKQVSLLAASADKGGLFSAPHTKWYDSYGNEYTDASMMTEGGTYTKICPHTHSWSSSADGWKVKTPATCSSVGSEERICTNANCLLPNGKETRDIAIDPTAHNFDTTTWESDGTNHWHECTLCGAQDTAIAHTAGAAATCTTAQTCTVCSRVLTAALTHSFDTSTWQSDGTNHWHECTRPNCNEKDSEGAHNPDRIAADCENAQVCTTCAYQMAAKLGHSYNDVVTPPTCETGGKTTHTCANCGDTYDDTQVAATGHNWGAPAWQWAANNLTCKAKFTCSNCNKEQLETASVTHTSATASCTVAGDTTYTASVTFNNNTYTDSKVISGQTLPHTWQLLHESVAPDCENDGAGQFECSVCQKQETRAIDKLGHVEVDDAEVPANCTSDGKTAGKHCSRCNKTLDGLNVIPALGHNWTTDWETDTTNHWHECTVCGEKKDDEAHTYDWVITKQPTVDEEGKKEEYCTVCQYASGNKETLAKLVVDDNGSVSDLPTGHDYDLEIAVKESDSLYNIPGITKGYKVELFVVDGEDRNHYDSNKQVTLMLVIPEGMEDEFTLYCRHGEILERVDPASYTVNGKSVTIRTTLPNEYVFNAPAPEESASGIPWWVWLIVGLVAAALLGIFIIIIVVAKKKKNDNTPTDNGEVLSQLAEQGQKIDELLTRSDDGGFNTPVELDENGNVIFK